VSSSQLIAASLVAYAALALAFAAGLLRARALARRGAPRATANRAPPSIEAPARVAFLGDVQRGIREVARPVVAAVRAEGVALVVSSGDLASHGEAPYHGVVGAAFDRAGLDAPLLIAPGNHDLEPSGLSDPAAGRARFEEAFGPRRWTARVGPLLLVGVDDAVLPLDADLWTWIEARVDEHAGPWMYVGHRPPRRMLVEGTPFLPGREALAALLVRRPPAAVVSGHLAKDAEAVVDGVRYVVNAEGGDVSGGAWFAPPSFHLRVADVDADGGVSWRRLTLARRTSWATALDQLAVRAWSSGRHWPALLFSGPARLALRALGRPVDP
jgi:hypothetical protein